PLPGPRPRADPRPPPAAPRARGKRRLLWIGSSGRRSAAPPPLLRRSRPRSSSRTPARRRGSWRPAPTRCAPRAVRGQCDQSGDLAGVHPNAASAHLLPRSLSHDHISSIPLAARRHPVDPSFDTYKLAEEHEALRESVRALAEKEIAPHAAEVDEQERYPQEA